MSKKLTLHDLQSDGGLFGPPINPPTIIREEHRHGDRKPLQADGVLMLNGTEIPVTTIDVSVGGLSIRSGRHLVVGKEYPLRFRLPVAGGAREFAVAVEAVYWFHTAERNYKTGLKFLRPSPELENAIEQFISQA